MARLGLNSDSRDMIGGLGVNRPLFSLFFSWTLMDQWLRQSTTNKNQQKARQDIQNPLISDRKRRNDDDKALQQALEASRAEAQQDDRYARDLEHATWLSRSESALHHTTIHVKPFGSSRLKTVTKEKSDDCGEWVVDSFLSNVLNQSSSVTKVSN